MYEDFNFRTNSPGTNWGSHKESGPGVFKVRNPGSGRRYAAAGIDWIGPVAFLGWLGSWSYIMFWPLVIANSVIWQGMTGKSLGKRMLGLTLCFVPNDTRDASWYYCVPGVARCAGRVVAHCLDLILFVGILRVLWNPYSRTFADSLASTSVIWDDRVQIWTAADAAEHRRWQ